ncbi:putative Exo-beta-1-3-glucanase [Venturia nashicola]|uniref:Putative Exo-beta-1-3-glucanae n=1 Tax=Venturia nashicola TaxID=86259 RepID=A0A4Z1PVS5_9PEZI|nr:putative Exo-beta-1-3-glucanae [Venturia nashicola]TLD39048.1 putative Exo-beta-1-3-glucanase [Venturia nashicola]
MPFWTSFVTVSSLVSIVFANPAPLPKSDLSVSSAGLSATLGNGHSRNPVKRDVLSSELRNSSSAACSYWMESMPQVGEATFNSDSRYDIFRNVKEFGAKGDGKTDDTAAINLAISRGSRCAPGECFGSTTTPATVYFPAGTYIVSEPIIDYYYTQIIGNPNCLPVIKASSNFTSRWVIDGNKYQENGTLGYNPATLVFYRQIANFVIDTTNVNRNVSVAGIHWPTAQATSLQNILFKLSAANGTQHEGVFIESGSGGFLTDLTFEGGLHGLSVGNQQFTMRNLTFSNAVAAINQIWDWGWTYKGLNINNCGIGINMSATTNGSLDVGSIIVLDSKFSNTPIGIAMGRGSLPIPPTGNSLILENVDFINVRSAIQGPNSTVLAGSVGHVDAWGQGNSYSSRGSDGAFQGSITPNIRPASLTSGKNFYDISKPYYGNIKASQIISARKKGAVGDGVTDDTDALNDIFRDAASSGQVVYINAGYYLVTKTIYVPPGVKIFGEAYPVILSSGPFFASISKPKPVLQIGKPNESGTVEISNLVISGQSAQAGAIFIEYNLATIPRSGSGLWDVHTRVGGFAGSQLTISDCPKQPGNSTILPKCIAGFMSMHITPSASGVYMENNWLWVADHDIEDPAVAQITVFVGRGLLIESQNGGNWLYGTSVEHHQLYEYNLASTKDVVLAQIQTETPYYLPIPLGPYTTTSTYNDPTNTTPSWGLNIKNSTGVSIYGAGLYSFFDNYNVTCSNQGGTDKCQSAILNVEGKSQVSVYNLNTVGTESMISVGRNEVANWADNVNGFVSTVALFRG